MTFNLTLLALIFSCSIIITILYLAYKKKVSIKFVLVWLILFTILILAMLIPGILEFLTNITGFQTSSNMIISLLIAILILINIASTVAISSRGKNIRELNQEIGLMQKEINDLKSKK